MADDPAGGSMDASSAPPLFDGLRFTIVPSSSLKPEYVEQLAHDVTERGGEHSRFNDESGHIDDLERVTHIISTTSDFPDYYNAMDHFIHVVKPSWVKTCIAKNKLGNPRQASPDPALFMSDVVVCCADIPEGDKEAIAGGVLAMGGTYSEVLTKQVTHLVALSLDNEVCDKAIKKNVRCQIVLPHWFDDCLKLGRKIAEGPYKLPDPDILSNKATLHPVPHYKENKDIRSATSPTPVEKFPTPTSSPNSKKARGIKAFEGKRVKLGQDLEINDHLRSTIGELIQNGGGSMTDDIADADIYVCHYREGEDYIRASQNNLDVGNLSWLYHLVTHNQWTSPMRRLLHYPVPRNGIPGFQKYKISLSNYTGLARLYLENLVKATGAEFTKTMRQDNTHLVTAHTMSEKCEAAREWNINIVNHLWIEESYAKCKEQSLTNTRYTTFPARTNLSEVIGQTQIDRTAVEKYYYTPNPKTPKSKVAGAAEKLKTNGVPASSTVVSAENAVDASSNPTTDRSTPLANKAKSARSDGHVRTPARTRHVDEKENETPSTTGSRGAKARALSKLHDLAPDIALFEKEQKRVGGVVHGRQRSSDAGDTDAGKQKPKTKEAESRKRTHESDNEEEEAEEEVSRKSKKKQKKAEQKKTGKTPIVYRMMLSKDDRWVDNPKKEAEDKNHLRELGIYMTEDPSTVSLLCAPKIVRTRKFVAAIAAAPAVVSTSYLDDALRQESLPDPEDYPLVDKESEDKWDFRLSDSLARASVNKRRLLKGWTIFCTEAVTGGWETFRDIITANGGNCCLWKGRGSMSVSRRSIDVQAEESQNQKEDEGDVLYLISEPEWKETTLWSKFRDLAKKHDMIPRIVRADWILYVCMAQVVAWDPAWELSEEALDAMAKKG